MKKGCEKTLKTLMRIFDKNQNFITEISLQTSFFVFASRWFSDLISADRKEYGVLLLSFIENLRLRYEI